MAVFTMNMIGVVDLIPPVISHLEDAQGNTVAALSVDENSAAGTVLGTVIADASAYSFAIVGGSSTFAISNTGQITVSNNSALDYETTTSLSFQVTASDYANNVSSALSVTVNILDVDDTPPVISRTTLHTREVLETISSNTLIAEYTASDAGTDVTANIFISTNPYNAFVAQYSGGTMKLYATNSVPDVVTNTSVTVTLAVSDAAGNVANYNQNVTIIDSTSFTGATLVNANSSFSGRRLTYADQMVKVGSYFYGWEKDLNTDEIWQLSTSGSINSQYTISHATYSSGQLGYSPNERWIDTVFSNGSTLFGITSDWVIYRASGTSWVQVGQVGNWVSSLPSPREGTFMHNGVLYVQTDATTSGDWKKVTGVSTSSAGSYQSSAFPGTVLYNSTSLTTNCDDCTVISGIDGYDWLLLSNRFDHIMVIRLDLGQYFGVVYGVEDWDNLEDQASGADHDNAFVSNGSYVYTPAYPNEVWRWDASTLYLSEK